MTAFVKSAAGLLALASVMSCAFAEEVGKPLIEPWGYPLDAFDRSVKPGDDFFRYANGGWLDATTVPSDRSSAGFSIDMADRNEGRIAAIIETLAAAKVKRGSNEQRIRDLYHSMMDEARIEAAGLAPLEADLARLAALATHEDVARAMGDPALGLKGPFNAGVGIDSKAPTRYIVNFSHSGLSLPDKTYYQRTDERVLAIRAAFGKNIETLLTMAGVEGAPEKSAAIFDLETSIAALHWDLADRRDADRTYNKMTITELVAFAPDFPWGAYLGAAGLDAASEVVVGEKDAFPAIAKLFADTPVEIWRAYLAYDLIVTHGPYLPKAFDDEVFSFYGRALNGQSEQRSRELRAIGVVNQRLDQAVGRIYVERYFPDESKVLMTEMFEDIRAALKTRIEALSWMAPETKIAALEKLSRMSAKIAYPEKWRDYKKLRIAPDDIIGNIQRARAEDAAFDASHLGKAVDKREWFTGPQTVNAFYSPDRNEAFIPAGYIQSPLFDPYADPAINYGAIGSIIGHEIGHGFDDQGSKSDATGVLRDWWTEADRTAFDALGDRLAAQYSGYEGLPGVFVNGRATLGENIGDLAGVIVAYHAYILSLDGAESPTLSGLTGAQRVFLGRAQARRLKRTEEAERRGLLSGVHSPMPLRVNGVVRNVDEWYEAFDIKPGDAMYLPPEERVRIW